MSFRASAILPIVVTVLVFVAAPSTSGAIEPGAPAPEISLPALGGGTLSLSSLRGKVVYIDIWASWCSSCKKSLQWMQSISERWKDRPFALLTVNVDESEAVAIQVLTDAKVSLPVVFDPSGRTPETYGLEVMPSSYVVGVDGKVIAVFKGFKESDKKEIENVIASAFPAQ